MKLKNQNVNADGTMMLKNIASTDEEMPTEKTKVAPAEVEPVKTETPVRKAKNDTGRKKKSSQ